MPKNLILCLLAASLWLIPSDSHPASRLRVVTTVMPLTDMVQQIAGDAIQLHGLIPAGANAHTFQPTPRHARYLAEADLVVLNGLQLDIPTEQLVNSIGKPNVTILKLGDQTIKRSDWVFDFSFPARQEHPNPHLWLNVAYSMTYITLIRDQLSRLDAANQQLYHRNAKRYLKQLKQLDACMTDAIRTIPLHHRKLLTYHDAWPYFARRYGLTVLGAVQPANFFEPAPREVAHLIEQLRQEEVPAIFGSAVFASKILAKIAAETGVRYVNTLRDDVLPGVQGEKRHSYAGMMIENVTTIVEALGGDPQSFTTCVSTTVWQEP
ncbi:MAG: metal ABC transporter substrate-binding protein [bacterium]|nr:metal ABC transporter substrate-binding protein [bacterium]